MVEVGSAFTAILVVDGGRLVDASAGTRGPIGPAIRRGLGRRGRLLATVRSSKDDLFRGGLADLGAVGPAAFRESLRKHVAGLQAVTPFERIYLSGAGLERPEMTRPDRRGPGPVRPRLSRCRAPGAWVKHAAQGSALLADALAGGRFAPVANALELHSARGIHLEAGTRIP